MSEPNTLLATVVAFRDKQIDAATFTQKLDLLIQSCEKKKQELKHTAIAGKDRELWNRDLLPGLEIAMDLLASAATEAKGYAQERDESCLANAGFLLTKLDNVLAVVEQKSAGASQETRIVIDENVAGTVGDSVQFTQQVIRKGTAELELSFLDPD